MTYLFLHDNEESTFLYSVLRESLVLFVENLTYGNELEAVSGHGVDLFNLGLGLGDLSHLSFRWCILNAGLTYG